MEFKKTKSLTYSNLVLNVSKKNQGTISLKSPLRISIAIFFLAIFQIGCESTSSSKAEVPLNKINSNNSLYGYLSWSQKDGYTFNNLQVTRPNSRISSGEPWLEIIDAYPLWITKSCTTCEERKDLFLDKSLLRQGVSFNRKRFNVAYKEALQKLTFDGKRGAAAIEAMPQLTGILDEAAIANEMYDGLKSLKKAFDFDLPQPKQVTSPWRINDLESLVTVYMDIKERTSNMYSNIFSVNSSTYKSMLSEINSTQNLSNHQKDIWFLAKQYLTAKHLAREPLLSIENKIEPKLSKPTVEELEKLEFVEKQKREYQIAINGHKRNWQLRAKLSSILKPGDKVCSFVGNKMGYVELVAEDRYKVLWKGQALSYEDGFFYGNMPFSVMSKNTLSEIVYKFEKIEEVDWTDISKTSQCHFDV